MTAQETILNHFLVGLFGDILRLEERSLAHGPYKNLSVSEMHLLDTAARIPEEELPTMATLAHRVGVSAGSLTVAVKALEQKEYLIRRKSDTDKRRVLVELTPKARGACDAHDEFHAQMVAGVCRSLSEPQLEALSGTLRALEDYFYTL